MYVFYADDIDSIKISKGNGRMIQGLGYGFTASSCQDMGLNINRSKTKYVTAGKVRSKSKVTIIIIGHHVESWKIQVSGVNPRFSSELENLDILLYLLFRYIQYIVYLCIIQSTIIHSIDTCYEIKLQIKHIVHQQNCSVYVSYHVPRR